MRQDFSEPKKAPGTFNAPTRPHDCENELDGYRPISGKEEVKNALDESFQRTRRFSQPLAAACPAFHHDWPAADRNQ